MESHEATYEIAAPVDVVWTVMTDHQRYGEWSRARGVHLERASHPHRDGVGAIRVFDAGMVSVREQVTEFEAPTRMSYRLLNRFPAKEHEATMVLVPSDAGTTLRWTMRFRPTVPLTGPLVRRLFVSSIDEMARGIAAAAEGQMGR